jgi:hypothetical protein
MDTITLHDVEGFARKGGPVRIPRGKRVAS